MTEISSGDDGAGLRPLLLLDVDGVLNPFGGDGCPAGFTEHDLFPGEEPVRLNPDHGAWIAELCRVFEVTWATGWNEEANRILAPLLGLSALPVLAMPPAPFHPGAKVPLIAAFSRRRPVAWIDDVHTRQAHAWSSSRRAPTLLIAVAAATGLTRSSVDQAHAWSSSRRAPTLLIAVAPGDRPHPFFCRSGAHLGQEPVTILRIRSATPVTATPVTATQATATQATATPAMVTLPRAASSARQLSAAQQDRAGSCRAAGAEVC